MRDVWLGLLLLTAPPAVSAPEKKTAAPLYTNDDLERVAPFRNQTGVASVPPAEAARAAPAPAPPRARGEAYWRREATQVRQQVRRLEARAASLRSRIEAERSRPRRLRTTMRVPDLEARLRALQLEVLTLDDELADRARREGALPGWLR